MPDTIMNNSRLELNRLERKIQTLESERNEIILYKHFFNESKDLVCVANTDGYFTKINPSFTELLGYTEEELLQAPFVHFIHPDDVQRTKDELEFMRMMGESTLKFENRYLTKAGDIIHLQWNTSLDWQNKIIYAIARDITTQKEIEDKLMRSEQLMRAAQNISKMGSWSFTFESSELYWSDELYNIFEIEKNTENLYQKYISRFNSEDFEKLNDNIAEAIMHSKPYMMQHAINLSDNRIKWIYCSGNPIKDAFGKVIKLEGFVQDITVQKNTEFTILNNIKEKDTLLQELHHRVKNNMQVISSLLNLQSSIINCPDLKLILRDSQQRIKSIASLHDILYQSNNLSHINFSNYMTNLIHDLLFSYKGTNHSIEINLDIPEINFTLDKAVPIGLFVNEILTNSLKHGFKESDSGQINIQLKTSNNSHELMISDNGVGFVPEEVPKDKTLGLLLIENLAEQVDGILSRNTGQDGTSYALKF